MPLRIPGRRLVPATALAALIAVAAGLALTGSAGPADARPASTWRPLPPDAFAPLTLATRGEPEFRRPAPTARPTAPKPVALKPPAGPTHVVRPGDTLWQIAAMHRSTVVTILRWNPAADPARLMTGQRLLIPGGSPMRVVKAASRSTARPRTPQTPLATSGRHVWPLAVRGTITTSFSSTHPGIDIAAPAGTRVRAMAAGTVAFAGWKTNGGGYVVVIRHGDGMISTYNHNRGVAVRAGQRVKAGQTVAWVGSTGWSTGPHLDFRIRSGGRLVNPLRVL